MRRIPLPRLLALVSLLVSCVVRTFAAQRATEEPLRPIAVGRLSVLERARDIGPAEPAEPLSIAVSLRVARPAELQAFVDSVSAPSSPHYREFLGPEEVGARFGLPATDVERVVEHLRASGFSITLVARNRLAVLANGTVARAERAFHAPLRTYELDAPAAGEPRRFRAFSTALALPADIAASVVDVSGLESYTRPRPCTTLLTPDLARGLYGANPLVAAGLQGAGRTIGMSNFDGFRAADWLLYINQFALPVPPAGAGSNITVVPVAGGGSGAGPTNTEGDLDIQMQLGMAPLADFRIYDSPPGFNLLAVLAQEASDDACDVISESWAWNLTDSQATAAHNLHLSMSAQGITYVNASGDTGTTPGAFTYPTFDPEVLLVGGTIANVVTPSGARISEIGWSGSGGGWSNRNLPFNVRPPWQTGPGVPPITPATDRRLYPDVAFHAAGLGNGAHAFFTGGTLRTDQNGTSFAAPLFAGGLALIELRMIQLGALPPDAAGHRRLGRLQDLVYAQFGRPDVWFDVVSGGNGVLPGGAPSACTPGWDTVTGWGPLDWAAFASVASCATTGTCGGFLPFCPGDDSQSPCPCDNFGAAGHGCANSAFAAGGLLDGSGASVLANDSAVLSATELTGATVIFYQASTQAPQIPLGDGLACAGGAVIRLGMRAISGGAAQLPGPSGAPIHVRGAIPPGGGSFYCQCFYRDPTGVCAPSTTNRTNGLIVIWVP